MFYTSNRSPYIPSSYTTNPQAEVLINNNISTKPLEGYLSGCGCKIKYKAKWKSEKCPLGKW